MTLIVTNHWYIFLILLSLSTLFNCISVIPIAIFSIKNICIKQKKAQKNEYSKRSIAFLVPCYNENEHELNNTINSIKSQTDLETNKKMLFIICDGRIKGHESNMTTDNVLKNMLKDKTTNTMYFKNAYTTWTGEKNNLEILYGYVDNLPFIVFIKDNNIGKRDSLVLIRSLLYNYNNNISNNSLSSDFENFFKNYIDISGINNFDYVVGTDADTVFDNACTSNLLREMASIIHSQKVVNGKVNIKLYKGNVVIEGRYSDDSLYDEKIASILGSKYTWCCRFCTYVLYFLLFLSIHIPLNRISGLNEKEYSTLLHILVVKLFGS